MTANAHHQHSPPWRRRALHAALMAALPAAAWAQAGGGDERPPGSTDEKRLAASSVDGTGPVRRLGIVTVNGGRASSLPSQIPTTIEGVTAEEIAQRVNATDSE